MIKRQKELSEIRALKNKEQKPIAESKRLANEVIEYLTKCGYSPVLKDDSQKEHFHIDIPRHKDDFWLSEEYKHCCSVLGKYYMEGDYGSDTYTLYVWREMEDQKPAEWSEEDEKIRSNLMSLLANMRGDRITEETYQKYYPWLKSLRSRPQGTYKQIVHSIYEMLKDKDFTEITPDHRVSLLNDIRVKCGHADEWADILDEPGWKPSEEQMQYLLAAINDPNNAGAESCHLILKSLYNDLKKL